MKLLNTAIKASITAGLEILQIYNNPSSDFSVERKADNSPLTIADKASNKIIEELLNPTNIPVLSEEGKNIEYQERKMWKRFWLVDPFHLVKPLGYMLMKFCSCASCKISSTTKPCRTLG